MADDDLLSMRSSEMGLDSLISVDIRSSFLKNFEVSVPVLKILGNDTMASIAELVAEGVPLHLLPKLYAGGDTTANGVASSSNNSHGDALSSPSVSNSTGSAHPKRANQKEARIASLRAAISIGRQNRLSQKKQGGWSFQPQSFRRPDLVSSHSLE